MKTVVLFVIVLVVVQLPNEGNAVCCHAKGPLFSRRCNDCSKGTPYCSREGRCNIFGCNCDGGCKHGPCKHHHGEHPMTPQVPIPYGGGHHVSYDSKPEAPYYASSASSYGSMSQPPVSYDTKPDVSNDEETQVMEEGNQVVEEGSQVMEEGNQVVEGGSQVMEEGNQVVEEESQVMEEEPQVVEEETQVVEDESQDVEEEPQVMEEESQVTEEKTPVPDESMYPYASYNEKENDMDIFGSESETQVSERDVIKARDISTPEDLIQSADENGDGLMDMDEAEKFLVKRGLVPFGSRVKRSLLDFDRNNDNFLSADEIEPFEEY